MDCARTLMIEKSIAIKYWKEAINTAVHTLNRVQLNKDSFKTPYELWYGYKPNVSYLNVLGSKYYILKESRKDKFDVKGDEGIFLGYSCKRKAYRCLNLSTYKVIESAHVKVDEFVERTKEESKREQEDYRRFVFIELDTIPGTSVNHESSTPKSSITKLQEVQTELHVLKLHSDTTEQVSTESEGPEPVATELEQQEPKVEVQEDNNEIHSKGKEPILSKYVRRHHSTDQIIGEKYEGTMTRSKLKSTCLLADFEP